MSKPRNRPAVRYRPPGLRWLKAVGLTLALAGLAPPVEAAPPTDTSRRFVSSQAYHHALASSYAAARGEADRVSTNLQLARVYDEDSPWLARRLAEEAWRRGDTDRARELARRIQPKANLLLAQVALLEGRSAEAMRRMTKEVLAAPTWDRARVEALLAFESRPEGRMVWGLARDRIAARSERYRALEHFARARPGSAWTFELLREARAASLPPPDALPAVARVLHHRGRDAEAQALAAQLAALWPGHRAVFETALRAEAWREGEPEAVAKAWVRAWPADRPRVCRRLVEEGYPDAALSRCPDAPAFERAGWAAAALRPELAWKLAGARPPRDPADLAAWFDFALAAGRSRAAVARWDDPARVRAEPGLWHRWVRALWVAGGRRRDQARRALATPPDGPLDPPTAGRIHALLHRHRGPEAADRWLDAQVPSPASRADARRVSAERRGDPDAAAAARSRRAELGPLAPGPAAAAALDAGGPNGRSELEALRRRYPDHPEVLAAAARFALARGRRAEARLLAERAARLGPEDPERWALLGATLRDHDRSRARWAWKRAARLYGRRSAEGWPAAEEALQRARDEIRSG